MQGRKEDDDDDDEGLKDQGVNKVSFIHSY